MSSLDLTLAAAKLHGWRLVLLGERSKRPVGSTWMITKDPGVICAHVKGGGNLGLVCGGGSGVAVLDFDDLDSAREMMAALGRIPPTVLTGGGKGHVYVRYEAGLPAKLRWHGTSIGEIQRGGAGPDGAPVLQQVVMPPSVHPNGGLYRWLRDPREPLPSLPPSWREHVHHQDVRPGHLALPTRGPHYPERACLDAAELLARAAQQPGARTRTWGVKFQCPQCAADGHDRHHDNAGVRGSDGRFGCAFAPQDSRHRRAIAEALGVIGGLR